MSDQLLRAHEMMAYVYNVADVEYPVSVRDQMNRARWLIEKAYDLGFFGPKRDAKHRRLLVCGAGAAGVTAALHAVGLGVSTLLIERSSAPFLRQRMCRSRWIDPTQYDWSADHWTSGLFPHAGPRMPLKWRAQRSHLLALGWQLQLNAALVNANLTFRRDYVTTPPTLQSSAAGDVVRVTFNSGVSENFGMVLWCVGFGDERRHAQPNFKGFAFWETDPFEQTNWGVQRAPEGLCAVVSGAGDGALQDVIRLITGKKSALDVFQEFALAGWTMPANIRHQLVTQEDQAQRALLWTRRRSAEEHRALEQLHFEYRDAVRYLVTSDAGRLSLIGAVRKLLSSSPGPVTLLYPCTHFARCYGLNHFLTLLLSQVAEKEKIAVGLRLRQQVGIRLVSSGQAKHSCVGSPWQCHGKVHKIDLEQRPSCYQTAGGSAGTEKAHVLVIRHGIAPNPAFLGTPMAFARQVMPYHLP